MIARRSIRLLTLVASGVVLAGPLPAAQPAHDSARHDSAGHDLASHDLASPNPLALLNRGTLTDFIEKPLFDPARRLPVVVPLVVEAPPIQIASPEAPPALHVLGVIEGAKAMAIARGPDTKTLMLHSGDHVGAWSVLVMPTGLRLSNGKRTSDYSMFAPSSGKGATPGAEPSLEPDDAAPPPPGPGMSDPPDPGPGRNARLQKRSF